MEQHGVDGRHGDHLQTSAQRVGVRRLVAPVLVLDDQRQGLRVVDELQQGGHSRVLDVIVPGQAAEHHQGAQPQGQAVGVGACRENMREAQMPVAGLKHYYYYIIPTFIRNKND